MHGCRRNLPGLLLPLTLLFLDTLRPRVIGGSKDVAALEFGFCCELDEVGKTLVDLQRGNVHCVLIQHVENLSNRSYN